MKNFKQSLAASLSQWGAKVDSATDKVIPGAYLSKKIDWLIPGDWDAEIAELIDREMGFHKMERSTRMTRPDTIIQQVTILPTEGNSQKKNMFVMLQEDGFDSILDLERVALPTFGSRQILTSPYELDLGGGEILKSDALIGPFSKYTPTFLWPWTASEGQRYTVHDLGEEAIGDIPGKTLVEYALGRELDQVGALPGFPIWGDPLLGLGPILIGGSAILILTLAAPGLVPGIGKIAGSLVKQTTTGLKEIGVATTEGLIKVAKAPFS
jgi:hypothetical protein